MSRPITILGIAGSLRAGSYNRLLLKAASALAPAGSSIDIFALDALPLYNQDNESPVPDAVAEFKHRIEAADAVLFVTPEYNYSVPGVLKNAIDWGSRPWGKNSWGGKPAAIMGTSVGVLGTARAQYHLRQMLQCVNMHVLNHPEIMLGGADKLFAADGSFADDAISKKVAAALEALVGWTHKMGS